MQNGKSRLAAPLAALLALTAVPTEGLAGPMSVTPRADVELQPQIDAVHWRRWRHHHWRRHHWRHHRYYRYGYDPAGAVFASAALGIMGAGIAAATAPRYYGYGYGYPYGYGYGYPYGAGWGGELKIGRAQHWRAPDSIASDEAAVSSVVRSSMQKLRRAPPQRRCRHD